MTFSAWKHSLVKVKKFMSCNVDQKGEQSTEGLGKERITFCTRSLSAHKFDSCQPQLNCNVIWGIIYITLYTLNSGSHSQEQALHGHSLSLVLNFMRLRKEVFAACSFLDIATGYAFRRFTFQEVWVWRRLAKPFTEQRLPFRRLGFNGKMLRCMNMKSTCCRDFW